MDGWTQIHLKAIFTTFLPHAKRLPGRKVLIFDILASHFNKGV